MNFYKMEIQQREREGTMGCLLPQSPKFCNNDFLFVGLTTLETLMNFDWYFLYVECSNVSTNSFNLQKGQFAYHYCSWESIYRPFSYLLRPLPNQALLASFPIFLILSGCPQENCRVIALAVYKIILDIKITPKVLGLK